MKLPLKYYSLPGLKKGDVVLKIGHVDVVDMTAYIKALGAFDKGQTVKVIVERDGKKIEKDLTF